MKNIIKTIIIAASLFPATAQAGWHEANSWMSEHKPLDKAAHVVVGAGIAYGLKSAGASPAVCILAPLAVGIIKELADKHFDVMDAGAWGVGAVIGVTVEF